MYNFGSPRVGDGTFCDACNALVPDSVRVVNRGPRADAAGAAGYRHVDRGVRVSVGADGAAEIAPLAAARGTDRYGEDGENGSARASAARRKHRAPRGEARGGWEPGRGRGDGGGRASAASSLASLDALADHFEDEYLVALRAARKT